MQVLDGGRIIVASRALGIATAAYEAAFKYAQDRVQFGRPISKFQVTRFKIARMAMELDAARLLTYRAAWMVNQKDEVHQGGRDGQAVRLGGVRAESRPRPFRSTAATATSPSSPWSATIAIRSSRRSRKEPPRSSTSSSPASSDSSRERNPE